MESAARSTLRSARVRLLGFWLLLLLLAALGSLVAIRQLLVIRAQREMDRSLMHDVAEFRTFATRGRDPRTGAPFRTVRQVLAAAPANSIPESASTVLTYYRGKPFGHNPAPLSASLLSDRSLAKLWGTAAAVRLGTVSSPVGSLRYAAIPVSLPGRPARGVVVTALFQRQEMADVNAVVRVAALAWLIGLSLATAASWAVTGRVLAPVRALGETARAISETDLERRIPVNGHDDLAELANTFNSMLDRLELAFETQRSFVRDAGHELRTPLTVIRGHVELIGGDAAEISATRALVLDEVDRMNRLVGELLELARSERPDFVVAEQLDLEEVTLELFAKADAMGQRRWTLGDVGRGWVTADRQRLTQAVLELVDNAMAHTGPSGLVTMGSSVMGREAWIWVADDGPGVAPADRERIFDRFARGVGATRSDGFGLGLSIVRAIAEAHGGSAWVEPSYPRGARFVLALPLSAGPHADTHGVSRHGGARR
ncbi:MAG: HAMP domain-containing sensor histidine kinase [Actinomycetota bacterium]|nr:HAMP domain-containing sensor histidine kinase [Actinomycetota bacterium]